MVGRNVTTCIIACGIRDECQKYYDLHCEIVNGIIDNFFKGKINDFDAIERAAKIAKDNLKIPVELEDCCLFEDRMIMYESKG